ncbi:MAG: glutamate 5-kinase [Planctomycetes bacterium]|nr:glutamate 5-kinase [Planctomycetota bacterium]
MAKDKALSSERAKLAAAKRIVVKIGSRLLTDDQTGVNQKRIDSIASQVAALQQAGREVILVSSGAIAAGIYRLQLASKPTELGMLQAVAAIGQGKLMRYYAEAFAKYEIPVGQMLLTRDGLDDRVRYLNIRSTLTALLELGSVPIINENDTVRVEEIQFGDNDALSAMVAIVAEADVLVILSDIDGLHEKPPSEGKSPILELVREITPEIEAMAGISPDEIGRGGMASKLMAAKRATEAGCGIDVVIASGKMPEVLSEIFAGKAIGTCFPARPSNLTAKKRWLAGRQPAGRIKVDKGARKAMEKDGSSLLPIGIIAADPGISVGDTVSIVDEKGVEFARGVSNFSGADLQKIARKQSDELQAILGYPCPVTAVHRDNLVVDGK